MTRQADAIRLAVEVVESPTSKYSLDDHLDSADF